MTLPVYQSNPPVPEVVRLALEYKAGIAAQNQLITQELARAFLPVQDALQAKILELMDEIKAVQDKGDPVGLQWVRELAYYRELRDQLISEIDRYSLGLEQPINRYMGDYALLGATHAANLTLYSFTAGTYAPVGFSRLPTDVLQTLIGTLQSGSPLHRLLQPLGAATWVHVQNSLTTGLAAGMPLYQIARNMAQASRLGLNRALAISRTEILRAYRSASQEQYIRSGVVTGFKRLANKATACMACLVLDGEYYPVAQAFRDHPNGACAMVPWVRGGREPIWEYGARWFEKQPAEVQIARMGPDFYQAWQDGVYELSDLATYRHSSIWGDSPQVTPLKILDPEYGE